MFQQNPRDMSQMTKPAFVQLNPLDFKFAVTDNEIDEFVQVHQKFPFHKLLFTLPASYHTTYGNVRGELEFNKRIISFKADLASVMQTLETKTTLRDKDITSEKVDRFSLQIHLEDIYFTEAQNKDNELSISFYLFGRKDLDPPLKDAGDSYAVIKVSFVPHTDTALEQKFRALVQELTGAKVMGTFSTQINDLISFILKLNKFRGNALIFKELIKKSEKKQKLDPSLQMKCFSTVSLYDFIPVKQIEFKSIKKRQYYASSYQLSRPTLNKPTSILTQDTFNNLAALLPQEVQGNNWILVYNPKFHGTSYDELLRRTKRIGQHVLLIKDGSGVVLGAYLEQGWTHSGIKFYGSSESFVFKIQGLHLQAFRASQLNQSYQGCNDEGLLVGGEDSHAIKLHSSLLKGESSGSITFNNPVLANESAFDVAELEIWGVGAECEVVLRHLRLASDFALDL